ncbi:MAG: FHA domain-containing protein [Prevotella sp.]|nr:FHA domain-containing protein [Prevotella sp.]
MEVIIGRAEEQNPRLEVVVDGKKKLVGERGSVPMNVSRPHVKFTELAGGKWKVTNIKDYNVTYVNGKPIDTAVVTDKDKVEIGRSHLLVRWDLIRGRKEDYIDISQLRYVWEDYNRANIEIRKRQKNLGLLASVPMLFTVAGSLFVYFTQENPQMKPLGIAFTVMAAVLMLIGFVRRFNDNSIDEQEALKKKLQHDYVCPKCGHSFETRDYDTLLQDGSCRFCRAKFKQ